MTGEQVRALGAGLLLEVVIIGGIILAVALAFATVWCYAYTLGHLV